MKEKKMTAEPISFVHTAVSRAAAFQAAAVIMLPCLVTAACFIYLLVRFYKKKAPLYLQIFAAAVGCLFLGKLYCLITAVSLGELPTGFFPGDLGTFGCFLFLASANFGVMDHITDDGTQIFRKYRYAALLGPLCVLSVTLLSAHRAAGAPAAVMCLLYAVPIGFSSYYSLKQLLFPDMDFLFLKLIKPCNLLAFIIGLLSCAEIFVRMNTAAGCTNRSAQAAGGPGAFNTAASAGVPGIMIAYVIVSLLTCAACICLTIFLERSRRLWQI